MNTHLGQAITVLRQALDQLAYIAQVQLAHAARAGLRARMQGKDIRTSQPDNMH